MGGGARRTQDLQSGDDSAPDRQGGHRGGEGGRLGRGGGGCFARGGGSPLALMPALSAEGMERTWSYNMRRTSFATVVAETIEGEEEEDRKEDEERARKTKEEDMKKQLQVMASTQGAKKGNDKVICGFGSGR